MVGMCYFKKCGSYDVVSIHSQQLKVM